MLPLQQAREVIQSIREYIRATFAFSNEGVERAFYDFIERIDIGPRHHLRLHLHHPFGQVPLPARGESCTRTPRYVRAVGGTFTFVVLNDAPKVAICRKSRKAFYGTFTYRTGKSNSRNKDCGYCF